MGLTFIYTRSVWIFTHWEGPFLCFKEAVYEEQAVLLSPLSRHLLSFRAAFFGILPTSFLNRWKSILLKFWVFNFLLTFHIPPSILNSAIPWLYNNNLTSFIFFVSSRSSKPLPLPGLFHTCFKMLPSMWFSYLPPELLALCSATLVEDTGVAESLVTTRNHNNYFSSPLPFLDWVAFSRCPPQPHPFYSPCWS